MNHNLKHHIIPKTIEKSVEDYSLLSNQSIANNMELPLVSEGAGKYLNNGSLAVLIMSLKKEMKQAAKNLDFERAALLRDEIKRLKKEKTLFGGLK